MSISSASSSREVRGLEETHCQSLRMCPLCKSLFRNATWQVLHVYGCVTDVSVWADAAAVAEDLFAVKVAILIDCESALWCLR